MQWRALRWLTVVVPLLFLALVDVLRHAVWPGLLHPWYGYGLVLAIVALATALFSRLVFDRVEAAERRILDQNRELRALGETAQRQAAQLAALHEAGLAVASDLNLEAVLQRVVELARELTNARYGALGIVDERGGIVRFLSIGVTPEQIERLGAPPRGHGLLGKIFPDSRPLRVARIADHPASVGFPPHHPPMTTLLGVPIVAHGRTLGNLYLTDKQEPSGEAIEFTEDDEALVARFAAQAAAAMENARLHAAVQGLAATAERERIARELHDSLAQALGYIRLRAATAQDALARSDAGATGEPAREAIREAVRDVDAVAAEAYADVREAILGLRIQAGADRGLVAALGEYLERYRQQAGVPTELVAAPGVEQARVAPGAEVQLLRIIQEALSNVRKHAEAGRALVRLVVVTRTGGPRLCAVVEDNGRGFDPDRPPPGGHYGLAIMQERAAGVGGTCRVESMPDRGTRVIVELPLETAPGAPDSITAGEVDGPATAADGPPAGAADGPASEAVGDGTREPPPRSRRTDAPLAEEA